LENIATFTLDALNEISCRFIPRLRYQASHTTFIFTGADITCEISPGLLHAFRTVSDEMSWILVIQLQQ